MLYDNSINPKKRQWADSRISPLPANRFFHPENSRLICRKMLFITQILFQVVTVFIIQLNFT